jgi:hypothetical protein
MSTPTVPQAPTVADPMLWGPYLHELFRLPEPDPGLDPEPDQEPNTAPCHPFADGLAAARELFAVTLDGAVPHGTYARVSRWGFTGEDPGEPSCTCGCAARVPVA